MEHHQWRIIGAVVESLASTLPHHLHSIEHKSVYFIISQFIFYVSQEQIDKKKLFLFVERISFRFFFSISFYIFLEYRKLEL